MDNSMVPAKRASAQSFAAYGTFVAASEGLPCEGEAKAAYTEKVGVLNTGGRTSVGVLNLKAREFEFRELERHVATPELLVMVKGDVIFPVSPASPGSSPIPGELEVFRVNQGEAVIMEPGVWHGLPFPLQAEATVLVIFREGTPDQDFQLHDLGGIRRCAP